MLSKSIICLVISLISVSESITFTGQCAVDCVNKNPAFMKNSCDATLLAAFEKCIKDTNCTAGASTLADLKKECQGITGTPATSAAPAPATTSASASPTPSPSSGGSGGSTPSSTAGSTPDGSSTKQTPAITPATTNKPSDPTSGVAGKFGYSLVVSSIAGGFALLL